VGRGRGAFRPEGQRREKIKKSGQRQLYIQLRVLGKVHRKKWRGRGRLGGLLGRAEVESVGDAGGRRISHKKTGVKKARRGGIKEK